MPKIFINAGHAPLGNPDPGAVNEVTGLRECDVTAKIAQKVSYYLSQAGINNVIMQNDSLKMIVDCSNEYEADLFLSIHCNSSDNEEAHGHETWYWQGSEEGKLFAACVAKQIVTNLSLTNRGIKECIPGTDTAFYVVKNTDCPAILVETAFISNLEWDYGILETEEGNDQLARAIARGVTDYFTIKEQEE